MNHTLIFLHIIKTAGTTIHSIIQSQYAPASLFFFTSDPLESLERFIKLPTSEKEKIKVVAGHLTYGIHEYITFGASFRD
jgi:hypothetical protein